MSTVIQNESTIIGGASSNQPASNKVLKSAYNSVLRALKNNKQIILITGEPKAGKTALLHTLSKDVAANNRIITLSGKDLPSSVEINDKNNDDQLNNIKDFILESSDIGDELIIVLDDAHFLPISFLNTLIERSKQAIDNSGLQLILSAPLDFKEQLLTNEQLSEQDLNHFPIDGINAEEIRIYAKNKSYKISSNIKRIEFKPEALRILADVIQSDRHILDVILEWCAALVNKDKLAHISSQTVSRAASFAQQFSKDKNLRLSNSYPPAHNVYKYINDLQSDKPIEKSATSPKVNKKSINKTNKNKPTVQSKCEPNFQQSKFPAITSNLNTIIENDSSIIKKNKVTPEKLLKLENETMQPQWVPSSKAESTRKNSFSIMTGLLSFLVLGFITIIAFQINSDPKIDESDKELAALNNTEGNNNASDIGNKIIEPNEVTSDIVEIQTIPVVTGPQPSTEIVINDSEKSVVMTEERNEIALQTASQDHSELANKTVDINHSQETQQISLAQQEVMPTQVDTTLSADINNLLILATSQFENKRLSTPIGNNALETYQKILEISPDNAAAINGIKKVHDRYLSWANYYFKNDDPSRAKHFYNKALSIDQTNTLALEKLERIARQDTIAKQKPASTQGITSQQETIQSTSVQNMILVADIKMKQIKTDIDTNNRDYKTYQEAQTTYQAILRKEPSNQQALQGLSSLINYYSDWAEQQILNKNYNIALFLYGQALAIQPDNAQITQRITQIRELNKIL